MKKALLLPIWIGMLWILSSADAAESKYAYPTQWLTTTTNANEMAFVLKQIRDLRLLFCDASSVESRISRKVCAVDYAFVGSGKRKEVPITGKSTLREILRKVGKPRWRGGQPQIRVVSQNAIIQSPIGGGSIHKEAVGRFLAVEVNAGDIVIIGWIE